MQHPTKSLEEVIARYGVGPRLPPDRVARTRLALPDWGRIDARHLLLAASCALLANALLPMSVAAADMPRPRPAVVSIVHADAALAQLDQFRANIEKDFGNLEFKLHFVMTGDDYKTAYQLTTAAKAARAAGDDAAALNHIVSALEMIIPAVKDHADASDLARYWPKSSEDAVRAKAYAKVAPHLAEVIRLSAIVPVKTQPAPSNAPGGKRI